MSTSIIEPGARLAGRYRLEDRVRDADGSTLWRAIDEILARAVAVRTFDPDFDRVGAVVTAARAASRLTDPRLTQVFDADDSGDQAYVVSEWVTGETLEEMISTHGPLDPGRAATLLFEAAEAVAAAHVAGLSHLRLTLRDLLWTTGGTVKVLGVAVDAELAGITADDPALVDAQGLGHMLYAALTGHWAGDSHSVLPAPPAAGGDRLQAPRQLVAGVPYAIDSVVCRVLDLETRAGQGPITTPAELAQALTGVPRTPLPLFAGLNPGPPPSIIPRQPRPPMQSPSAGPAAASPPPRSRGVRPPAQQQGQVHHGQPQHGQVQHGPAQHGQAGGVRGSHGPQTAHGAAGRPGAPGAAGMAAQPGHSAPGGPGGPGAHSSHSAHAPAQAQTAFHSVGTEVTAPAQRGAASRSGGHGSGGSGGRRPLLVVAALVAVVALVLGVQQLTGGGNGNGGTGGASGGQSATATPKSSETKLTVTAAEGYDPHPGKHPDTSVGKDAEAAIDKSTSSAWNTQSYADAQFGKYKDGVGLLLDMGRSVTISKVKVTMPSASGGVLQLRIGDSKDFDALQRVGERRGLSDDFDITPDQTAKGRYIALWITELPMTGGDRPKAFINNVAVYGSEG